jgi:hypothetical protein
MQLSTIWEAASSSATQQFPQHVIGPEGSYGVQKSLVTILYEKNLVHTTTSEWKNHFNIILWPTSKFS